MKAILQSLVNKLGYDVRRVNVSADTSSDPYSVMRDLVAGPAPVVFDVGAHVGNTVKYFRSRFPFATIYCFEPFRFSFEQLQSSVVNDSLVKCYQLALSDDAGSSRFTVNSSTGTNSLLPSDVRGSDYWGPGLLETREEIEVVTETLSRFCSSSQVPHIDILKMDVQGAEYSVLEGARELLERQCIDIIYMEMLMAPTYVGQRKFLEYLLLLAEYGYEIFDFYYPCRASGRLIQTDIIVVSPNLLGRHENSLRGS